VQESNLQLGHTRITTAIAFILTLDKTSRLARKGGALEGGANPDVKDTISTHLIYARAN